MTPPTPHGQEGPFNIGIPSDLTRLGERFLPLPRVPRDLVV